MEIQEEDLETVHANIFEKLKNISIQKIFEIKETRYHHIRASVPRAIFEENAKQKVVKKGTDVQVKSENFPDLIKFYLEGTKLGIKYCLFGHFGDAHLHFNFLPESDQELEQKIEKYFLKLYEKVLLWKGSPFAEHGIGLLKQNYIRPYHKKKQKELFLILKKKLDPHLQFFPQGFMRTSS